MPTTEHLAKMLEDAIALGLFEKPNIPNITLFATPENENSYFSRLSNNTDTESRAE